MYFLFTGRWAYKWGGGGGLIIGSLRIPSEKLSNLPHRKDAPPSLPSERPMRIELPTSFFLVVITFCVFSPLLYIVESNRRLFPNTT